MTRSIRPHWLALGAALLLPTAATAYTFPPAGTNQFIAVYEIGSIDGVCDTGVTCDIAFGPGPSTSLPLQTYPGTSPFFITAGGDVAAGSFSSFLRSNVSSELDVAMRDVYTVQGSAVGPFDITLTFHATGTAGSMQAGPFQQVGAVLNLIIGTYDIDPASTINPTVHEFNSSTRAGTGFISQSQFGTTPFSVPVDLTLQYTRSVSVGTVFELGYMMQSTVTRGDLDLSHTGTISFDTPDGVYLTSALGGTFGDVPVPEPAAVGLLLAGLAELVVRRWRAGA